ncbi:unnamed protein product [Gongylonema pulchrum]|uniref:TFIIIC_sub6 domain-containing protein n=1 Tax=Gongylonema pulchrum TaxID=637853 RepID=A0A183DSU2_9BILA|nr:unnamed protein product [Gongylonema pulchrum]
MSDSEDKEWEEKTLVLEIGGIMDVNSARQALLRGDCAIRRANTENPMVQIANSLFTSEWSTIVGSDIILRRDEKQQQLRYVASSDVRLKAEKALVTGADESSKSQ